MRYLAVDVGDKRTGLAAGDDVVRLVQPVEVIQVPRGPALLDALARAVGAPLRLAAAGEALTGFRHGGVTPLGSSTPLAVVVAKQLARRRFFWIGGGEPDVKLRVFSSQLLRAGGAGAPGAAPVVLDIAEELGEEESEQGGGGGGSSA